MVREKFRIRFRKGGDLRWVSHHDLMRCFERMLRRAALPFRSSEGFNPKPRMSFPLSLGLGILGASEVLELELTESLTPEDIHTRLAAEAPAGLEILSVRPIAGKRSGQVRRIAYRITLPTTYTTGLEERIAEVLASSHCPIERSRPHPRQLDARPFLCGLRLRANDLEMELSLDGSGTARPEEILALLGIADCLTQGATVERTTLELEDERVPVADK
jgi:radical SAM-linked protein